MTRRAASARLRVRALAVCSLMPLIGAANSPSNWGPLHTDDVAVESVVDPKVGSGILKIFAEVAGTTSQREKRNYFILYFGSGQTLPAVGTRCKIDYRDGAVAEGINVYHSLRLGRIVEHFECSDSRHWSDRAPMATR
jgi:hypothetical protein